MTNNINSISNVSERYCEVIRSISYFLFNLPYVRVAEGAVLKTVDPKGFAGSNPVYGVYANIAQ